ncbi:MFS transporter [Fodinicola acaciae]|uniref:MFS transporter n=1 Tax=Fodinicola acaciae TaxID=2681555 RepID=UPI0013D86868|nr:MFS transporter [Fodinicola acaciae]
MTTATLTRPRLLSRGLVLVVAANFGALTSFYLLLSVVPLFTATLGDSGAAAGLSTGLLMTATVVAELVTPRLVIRLGYRRVFAAGLTLLGLPALVLAFPSTMATVMIVSLVRGVGFAIIMVVAGALIATLLPPERRGEGLGITGMVACLPGVLALPAGIWLANVAGFAAAFTIGGVAALVGLLAIPWIPVTAPGDDKPVGVLASLRTPALNRPAIVFATTAMAGGIVAGFLPLAITGGSVAAAGLFVQAAAATGFRWLAGRYGDRYGAGKLLVPGATVAAIGLLPLVVTHNPVTVLAGMAVFGAGFGVAQNASMTLMLSRVSPASFGSVSAVWNIAYDAGWGWGAAAFGLAATQLGYSPAFAATAALMLIIIAGFRRAAR